MVPLLVNTTTKCADLWDMFFGELWEGAYGYVMVDETDYQFPREFRVLYYDRDEGYRQQIMSCLDKVDAPVVLYTAEDNVMLGRPQFRKLKEYSDILMGSQLDFVKLIKGLTQLGETPHPRHPNLWKLQPHNSYFFTMQPSLWWTESFKMVYKYAADGGIAGLDYDNMFEVKASETCRDLEINGVYCYHGERKRGAAHYDSSVFPFCASAIVKGKWNISEYPELKPLLDKYKIDPGIRGVR